MARLVVVLLVGAGWTYGYYGYKDKSSAEMLAVNLELGFDVVMLVGGFLLIGAYRKRTAGT